MKHWYTYILATLMAILPAACTDDDKFGTPDGAEGTEVYVSVRISTNSPANHATRTLATGSDMKEGLDYDNYIQSSDVDLYIFDNDLKFVAKSISMTIANNAYWGIFDQITQEQITASQEKPYHIVAVCNHSGATATLTEGTSHLDDLISQLTYNYTSTFTADLIAKNYQSARIPMWGILPFSFDTPTSTSNVTEIEDPINVLRAMAKVRIRCAVDDYTIESCTLNVANKKGYVAAQKYNNQSQAYAGNPTNSVTTYTTNWNYVEDTNNEYVSNEDFNGDRDYTDIQNGINHPSIHSEAYGAGYTPYENLVFSKNVTDTDKSGESHSDYHVIYIPEYNHIKDEGETNVQATASMTLSIQKGSETKSYTLHFADYSNGATPNEAEWDIIRNDIYEYTITGITETGGLEANVRVIPWTYETMSYELSQEAKVKLLSEPQAVNNANTNNQYANEVAYSLNDADPTNYATFLVRVDEPKGVRWVAHLTNPYYFTFTADSQTEGFGGTGETATITVKPRDPNGIGQTAQLFFTIETLIDSEANISPSRTDLASELRQHYAIRDGSRIDITQVSSKSKVDNDIVPFVVKSGLYAEAGTGTYNDKTYVTGISGLTYPAGIETVKVFDPSELGTNCLNNGVVMAAFKGKLYCMWQTSAYKEDTPDTYIYYSVSENKGESWSDPAVLWQGIGSTNDGYATDEGYVSSGGWLVTDNKLVAYVNTWLGGSGITSKTVTVDNASYTYSVWGTKPTYGKTRYMTTTDGTTWSTPADLGMEGGNAIFEQDPHVIELKSGGKRIINAAHFQNIGEYTNGLYVSPIYADYTDGGITGWKQAEFAFSSQNTKQPQSREMEPSMFRKANGSLVMIFRDNQEESTTQNGRTTAYRHRVRASISTDEGLTWSTPVETDLPDSKSKQCAGNLPDGTAFIINNPVASEVRVPLVISLSKDGENFDTAYLLRSAETTTSWDGQKWQNRQFAGGSGYVYPKAMVHGDYLYVSYSTNKEDVEYTRIPLSSIQLNDPTAR